MGQSDESWNEVGEGFKKLGSIFRDHYRAQEGEKDAQPVSEEEVKDAVNTLGASIKTAFASLGDALGDPDVHDEAKSTARAFVDAMGATFSDIGDEISRLRNKEPDEPPSRTDAAPADPAESGDE